MATAMDLNRFCQLRGTKQEINFQQLPNSAFKCTLNIPGVDHSAHGVATSKKGAQDAAVKDIISYLTITGELEQAMNTPPAAKKRKTGNAAAAKAQVAQEATPVPVFSGKTALSPGAQPLKPQQQKLQQAVQPKLQPKLQQQQQQQEVPQQAQGNTGPKPIVEDGMGNFSIEVARGKMNEQLKKWRQPTDINIKTEGPPHQPVFRATIKFQVPKLGKWITEQHVGSVKKQVQNELALKVCRKLFAMGVMQKYARSFQKGTFWDAFQESKYYESGSFGFGLAPQMKTRIRNFLTELGADVPHPDAPPLPPGTVLLNQEDADAMPESEEAWSTFRAVDWAPPGAPGSSPWPPPKSPSPVNRDPSSHSPSRWQLPVAQHHDAIVQTIAQNQVCIILGATGSGKTTQVPQYILDSEDGLQTIIVAQPRRLAAITVAQRVAAERGESLGASVGYAVRFDSVWPQQQGGICYMTTGLVLKRLHRQGLRGVSHVVVDEVHERDLHNDLLMGLLRSASSAHPSLKVVLMSATIDVTKFQHYMSYNATASQVPLPPVVKVEGRIFDVETHYLEDVIENLSWYPNIKRDKEPSSDSMNTCDVGQYSQTTSQALGAMSESQIPLELMVSLLSYLITSGSCTDGAVLIFLPTWGMMSLLHRLLSSDNTCSSGSHVILLHSHVPKEQQMEAFKPPPNGLVKVILATNIAESSITIDDVSVVIDSCRVKLTFFSEHTGLSYHTVVWSGRMNLEQRKGRAGRTRPGVCFRMCSRRRFEEGLEDEVPPELTRTPLIEASLLVKSLNLGYVAPVLSQCMDPPAETAVEHAISELRRFRALDDEENLTPLGRILARLPIDPRIGLALLMGHWFFRIGDAMATICAAMSFEEPFPFDKTAGYLPWSVQQHFSGKHKHSDQYVLGQVHQEYARIFDVQGEQAAAGFCSSEGLHPAIMRQVRDASEQLRALLTSDALGALSLEENDSPELGLAFGDMTSSDLAEIPKPQRNHSALRDWDGAEWQWGAVQLLLATALPHLAVHQEKRHVWVSEDTLGAVHKGSVNCCKNTFVFPSPLFTFLDQVKEGGWKPPRCRQSSVLPPLLAVLRPFASGEVKLDDVDGTNVVVGSWIPLGPVTQDTAHLVLYLRRCLEEGLVHCANCVAAGETNFGPEQNQMIALLKELLTGQNMRYRETHVAGGGAAAKGGAAGWAPHSASAQTTSGLNWKGAQSQKGGSQGLKPSFKSQGSKGGRGWNGGKGKKSW